MNHSPNQIETNMKTNSKLKNIVLVIALALVPLLASERASAQNATATIFNGGIPGITVGPGSGTFTFDINIVTTFTSVGMTYFLQSNDGSGFFSLTGRNIGASPFNDLITTDAVAFTAANGLLDPVNNDDLGAVIADPNTPLPAGSYFISTMSLSYAGLAPGTYHIFFDSRTIVSDGGFNDHQVTANVFTITVVPEPATTGLAVLGGVMLLGFVWRARRALA
jgi:PEP-CTERM motif